MIWEINHRITFPKPFYHFLNIFMNYVVEGNYISYLSPLQIICTSLSFLTYKDCTKKKEPYVQNIQPKSDDKNMNTRYNINSPPPRSSHSRFPFANKKNQRKE